MVMRLDPLDPNRLANKILQFRKSNGTTDFDDIQCDDESGMGLQTLSANVISQI